jgi:hypothetical protein
MKRKTAGDNPDMIENVKLKMAMFCVLTRPSLLRYKNVNTK